MSNWIICPMRGGSKVSLEVCLRACEKKYECDEFAEVPRAELEALAKKLNIPLKALDELEPVIDIESENRRALSAPGRGESREDIGNDREIQPKGANTSGNFPQKAEITNQYVSEPTRKAWSMELYEKLLILRRDIGAKFIEMGEVLNEFYDKKYYLDVGYKDWEQFCSEALDFNARWALDIRKIALKKNQLKLSDQEIAEVGVKKMAQLLPVITDKRSADHWLKEAKKPGVTTERLIAKVRHARGRLTKEEAEKVPVKYILPVYEEDVETVERAFELAKEVTGSDSRGVQFVGICDSFRCEFEHQTEDFDKKRIVTGMVKRLAALFKVNFVSVIDLETGEIIIEG